MPVKEYCRWTDAMKLRLVKLTHKYKGYIKTDDNFKEKWTIICEKLLIDYPDLIIKPAALQNQFWRFSDQSLKDLGISEEGANLSGLPETCGEFEKLVVTMAHEVYQTEKSKKAQKAKKAKIQKALLTHEKEALLEQGSMKGTPSVSTTSTALFLSEKEDDGISFSLETLSASAASNQVSTSGGSASEKKAGKSFLDKFNAQVIDLLKDESDNEDRIAAKKQKLDHTEREMKLREEDQKKQLTFQERMLKFQEDQLELQREEMKQKRNEMALRSEELKIRSEEMALLRQALLNSSSSSNNNNKNKN